MPENLTQAQQLVHKHEVHQTELQLQNKQHLATQRKLEASRHTYFYLYNLAPVAYFYLRCGRLDYRV